MTQRESSQAIGLLYGGVGAERNVSLRSARFVADQLTGLGLELVHLEVSVTGRWMLTTSGGQPSEVVPIPGRGLCDTSGNRLPVDVVFSVIHGLLGEDGHYAALLRTANVACVGAGVAASLIGMDKELSKIMAARAGIAVAPFRVFTGEAVAAASFDEVWSELGPNLVVKPLNTGSSVGVAKVASPDELVAAAQNALRFDTRVIVERDMSPLRELEVAVFPGVTDYVASPAGEIITRDSFYSYDAKYNDAAASDLVVPARLDAALQLRLRHDALRVFHALRCSGFARVDFFLRGQQIIFNEINTLPGFTPISLFPRLVEASGCELGDVLRRAIAIARNEAEAHTERMHHHGTFTRDDAARRGTEPVPELQRGDFHGNSAARSGAVKSCY